MVLGHEERLETLVRHVVHTSQREVLREISKSLDLIDKPISIDCTTLMNHCICAENFEYFRKPDHLIQCIRKEKCFHCQRYRCMDRKYDAVTASTKLILIAAALGKFDVFRFLHRSGCCLESTSGLFELRPLHLAIVHGHFNIFCYLLGQRVDVNATIQSHGTSLSPLMLAVKHQQDDMVRHLLMVRGINLAYRNSMLQSPVLFAVQNNNIDLVNLLLSAEEDALNNKLESRRTELKDVHHPCAMLQTIREDNVTALKVLLDGGCQADYVFNGYHWQTTAVILAAILNSHACLELLVDCGADTEMDIGGTALQWAIQLDWSESINILHNAQFKHILSGFDSDVQSSSSNSCSPDNSADQDVFENDYPVDDVMTLHASSPVLAVWRYVQWLDIDEPIRRLVTKGHDIDVQDKYGRTSLHLAVEEQSVVGVRTLIQLGANLSVKDMCGATPLWHAVYWNKESMIKELMFANAPMECKAREDAYRIGLPWVEISDKDTEDHEYQTTLSVAVKKNFLTTVRMLLEAGYDTKADDYEKLISSAKPGVRDLLISYSSQPRSLVTQTRNFVRKLCGARIHELVDTAHLPRYVQDSLLLRDLMNLKIEPTMRRPT